MGYKEGDELTKPAIGASQTGLLWSQTMCSLNPGKRSLTMG